ncbi:MAG: hypothetical protein IKP67_01135 [Spirochaetales bacterium]|nr:hypothetical protein [Lachnospiraceae bacterium]MBR6060651.1 hypothetical protein [Spirochaetales bacterium]
MKKIALEDIIFIPEYHENQIYSYHSGKIEEDVDKESPIGGLIMSMHDRDTEEKLGYVHFIIAESADFIDMDGESSELGMAYVAARDFTYGDDEEADLDYPDILHIADVSILDDLKNYWKYLIAGAVLSTIDFLGWSKDVDYNYITSTDLPIGFGLPEEIDISKTKEQISRVLKEIGFTEIPYEETIYSMFCCRVGAIEERFEEVCNEIKDLEENIVTNNIK